MEDGHFDRLLRRIGRAGGRSGATGEQVAATLAKIVWYAVWLLLVLLAFRFVLKLLGADPASRFASAIYQMTFPLVSPFLGIIPTPQFGPAVIEGFTLIAMICYVLLGTAVAKFFELFVPEPAGRAGGRP